MVEESNLKKSLAECGERMTRYGVPDNVRKYENFSGKLKVFKSAVDDAQDLCEELDNLKLSKVDFTFKQVSKYFEDIFQILVPNGKGKLVFDRKDPEQSPGNEDGRPASIFIK